MKKRIIFLFSILLFVCAFIGIQKPVSAATNCGNGGGDFASFDDLNTLLRNYSDENATYTLTKDIVINSTDGTNYGVDIDIPFEYMAVIDMNGHNITVNSNGTKSLFNITGKGSVSFINSKDTGGTIQMNTAYTKGMVCLVEITDDYAQVTNYNCKLVLTTSVETSPASNVIMGVGRIGIYGGELKNYIPDGHACCPAN